MVRTATAPTPATGDGAQLTEPEERPGHPLTAQGHAHGNALQEVLDTNAEGQRDRAPDGRALQLTAAPPNSTPHSRPSGMLCSVRWP